MKHDIEQLIEKWERIARRKFHDGELATGNNVLITEDRALINSGFVHVNCAEQLRTLLLKFQPQSQATSEGD